MAPWLPAMLLEWPQDTSFDNDRKAQPSAVLAALRSCAHSCPRSRADRQPRIHCRRACGYSVAQVATARACASRRAVAETATGDAFTCLSAQWPLHVAPEESHVHSASADC